MDFTQIMPMLIPAAIAAGYWAIGWIESKGYGEPFNLNATLRTLFVGIAVAFVQALAGVVVGPTTITTLAGFDSLLIIAVSKILNKVSATPLLPASTAKPISSVTAAKPAPAAPITGTPGFVLPRDGKAILNGSDGWTVRINPSPEAATIPDDKAYQAVSPKGTLWSGDKDTVLYLVTSPDAARWRSKFA